jgi:hypothetical protein
LIGVAAALVCIAVGLLSRFALNPDGVSYLDLMAAVRAGDMAHFVQGYWSPLFPLLIGVVDFVFHPDIDGMVLATHLFNIAATFAAIVVLICWARRAVAAGGRYELTFITALFAVFMLCSAGLPRVESVTPDVLLLALTTWLSYELIARGGERWIVVGLLFGGAYLTKTSAWPWLLLAVPVRLWFAPDGLMRRLVWRSTAVAAAVMSLWVVPLSIHYGRPTLGSSGRLNFSWYIAANSSRLPDSDRGAHRSYQGISLGNGGQVEEATFADASTWTYQPWGDPTAWQQGVLSETGSMPSPLELLGYWGRMLGYTFGLWLGPMIAGVLLPLVWLQRRNRRIMTTNHQGGDRHAAVVATLGALGLLQFVAVHTEPRLLAPFGAMFGFGVVAWCWQRTTNDAAAVRRAALVVAGIAAAVALGFSAQKVVTDVRDYPRIKQTVAQLREMRRQLHAGNDNVAEIAVIGPVAPVMQDLYWVGAHVAAQLPPRSIDQLRHVPPEQQRALLVHLFGGKYAAVWQTTADGEVRVVVVPSR